MRKCTCGCTVFDAVIKRGQLIDGLVDFESDGRPRYWKKKGGRTIDHETYDGPYTCTKCGKEYETYYEIPYWGTDHKTGKVLKGKSYC